MGISKAADYIKKPARLAICAAIRDNNGSEVFFIGKVDEDLLIYDVEAHAFGGKNAVPVLLRLVEYGDVVIHNHPDGRLEPSDADVDSAAALGDLGVGSYIIDNQCEKLHVLVKAFREKGLKLLPRENICSFFSPRGPLAEKLPQFEHRPQQINMTQAVIRAFNEDKISVIEAGTGTGKSLAYLAPAIWWSVTNKDRVVVSTNTINLQEQLVNKDLPFLREKTGLKFNSVLMKGRQNYLCLRRLRHIINDSLAFEEAKDAEVFQEILQWAKETSDGSLSDLNITPPARLWNRICCESDTCPRTRCDFYEDCFFFRARRQAARANILVVNHHLLMADLALRKVTDNYTASAVLPPFRRIILDEAHNVERVATSHFSITVTRRAASYNLGRLASRSRERGEKGLFYSLAGKLFSLQKEHRKKLLTTSVDTLRNQLIPEVYNTGSLVDTEFSTLTASFLAFLEQREIDYEENIKLWITEELARTDFWQSAVSESVSRITSALYRLSRATSDFLETFSGLSDKLVDELSSSLIEINAVKERLELVASNLQFIYRTEENYCKWLEYKPAKHGRRELLIFCLAPIDIRESMRNAVYDVNRTVVMTSATLTVQNRFEYMLDQLGLVGEWKEGPEGRPRNSLPPAETRVLTEQLGTPFDYEKQAFVGVATNLPDPTAAGFPPSLESAVMKALNISQGRAFVLFTSYRLMDRLFRNLSPLIHELGYPCFCQGQEPRHKLLQKFILDPKSVLFATASFWEGVDVRGRALECLIITRLPFRVPTEPLQLARARVLEEQGRDPFRELNLPEAVIRFKQGFGRLIRSRTDRGAVLIFDRRVATKYYGQAFLSSLPTRKIYKLPTHSLFQKMRAFFTS